MSISDQVRGAVLAVVLMAGSAEAMTLKIATLSPEGSSWMELLRAGESKPRMFPRG